MRLSGSRRLIDVVRNAGGSSNWIMIQLAIALRHHKAGRLVEAEAIALALNPNDATMHVNLGSSLRDLGNTKNAVAHYARALQLNLNFAEAHHNLGTALLDQRRHERCRYWPA